MTIYNVHIFRELRLTYGGIEAESREEAAMIARDKPTEDADAIHDCEGETFAAVVDVQGDGEYGQSRTFDFDDEQTHIVAPEIQRALRMASNYMADGLDESDETEMRVFNALRAAIAIAEPPADHRRGQTGPGNEVL